MAEKEQFTFKLKKALFPIQCKRHGKQVAVKIGKKRYCVVCAQAKLQELVNAMPENVTNEQLQQVLDKD